MHTSQPVLMGGGVDPENINKGAGTSLQAKGQGGKMMFKNVDQAPLCTSPLFPGSVPDRLITRNNSIINTMQPGIAYFRKQQGQSGMLRSKIIDAHAV